MHRCFTFRITQQRCAAHTLKAFSSFCHAQSVASLLTINSHGGDLTGRVRLEAPLVPSQKRKACHSGRQKEQTNIVSCCPPRKQCIKNESAAQRRGGGGRKLLQLTGWSRSPFQSSQLRLENLKFGILELQNSGAPWNMKHWCWNQRFINIKELFTKTNSNMLLKSYLQVSKFEMRQN